MFSRATTTWLLSVSLFSIRVACGSPYDPQYSPEYTLPESLQFIDIYYQPSDNYTETNEAFYTQFGEDTWWYPNWEKSPYTSIRNFTADDHDFARDDDAPRQGTRVSWFHRHWTENKPMELVEVPVVESACLVDEVSGERLHCITPADIEPYIAEFEEKERLYVEGKKREWKIYFMIRDVHDKIGTEEEAKEKVLAAGFSEEDWDIVKKRWHLWSA